MNWPLVTLADIAPSKPIKLEGFGLNEEIWQITLDQIESNTGRLLEKSVKPLSEAGSSTHAFDKRYVLYSKLRPYLNKVLLPDEIGVGTTELVPMLPDSNRLDRGYLAHYLKSKKFVSWISSQTAGAKMPRVSMKVFWSHAIPLPPLKEQKRIAAILDKADAIRRKRQQGINLTDQLLRSVFLDMFGDPVMNPKSWNKVALEEVCRKITDGTHHSPKPQESGVYYITAKHVKPNKLEFDLKPTYISEEAHREIYARCNPELNDVLYIKDGATTGIAAINPYDFEFSMLSSLALIKVDKKKLLPEFLCDWLNFESVKERILRNISGAAITRLTIRKIKDIIIELPPLDLQEEYCKIRSKIMKSQLKFDSSVDDTEKLFSSLTRKAFNGELSKQAKAA